MSPFCTFPVLYCASMKHVSCRASNSDSDGRARNSEFQEREHLKMKKRREKERCAYCDRKRGSTRDHVPPQCVFLRPLPGNMITVPSCKKCQGSSEDDEYFSVLMLRGAEADASDGLLRCHRATKSGSDENSKRSTKERLDDAAGASTPGLPVEFSIKQLGFLQLLRAISCFLIALFLFSL